MKTDTQHRILRIIRMNEGTRPIELARKLGLSPQAIHRHLRKLVASAQIETQGRGPRTRYFAAGRPQLDRVVDWCTSTAQPSDNPSETLCETRDVFTSRLSRISSFLKVGLKEEDLSLVISAAGEIGNNCFDHNIGIWRDIPGCWFETQLRAERLWICIADRGQGIFQSLKRVDPSIPDAQAALMTAFEKTISGRAPENRGNGLKFVRNIIMEGGNRGLACRSGSGLLDYGNLGQECRSELNRFPHPPVGTMTLVLWRL